MSDGYQEFGLLQRREGVAGGGVCLRDSGILVEFLASRFAAGESIDDLASDYGRSRDEIEAAMRIIVLARGRNLWEKRAMRTVEKHVPLLTNLRTRTERGCGKKKRGSSVVTTRDRSSCVSKS